MGPAHSKALLYGRLIAVIPPPLMMGTDSTQYFASDKGQRVFADEADRDQFVHTLLALLSSNSGLQSLQDHDFKLLYSRRAPPAHPHPPSPSFNPQPVPSPQQSKGLFSRASSSKPSDDDGTRLVATLVAIDPQGVIRAKIEPEADGKTIAEAFRAFKRDVEWRLGELLRDVPSGVGGDVAAAQRAVNGGDGRGGGDGRDGRGGGASGGRSGRGGRARDVGPVGENGDAPPAYGDVKTGLH